MSNRTIDSGKNSPYRRGTVIERDPARGKVKVKLHDEDGDTSFWLHVNQLGTGKNKFYRMPDVDDQVTCLMDWDGEDGVVMGAIWSEGDAPPTGDGDTLHISLASGVTIIANQATGDISIAGAKSVSVQATAITLEAADITFKGNVAIEGASLTHNGKNVGDTHGHVTAPPGPPGPPVG